MKKIIIGILALTCIILVCMIHQNNVEAAEFKADIQRQSDSIDCALQTEIVNIQTEK